MKRIIAVATVLVMCGLTTPGQAAGFLNAGCTASTVQGVSIAAKTPKNPSGTADVVDANKIDRFEFNLPSGEHYLFVQGVGDTDIAVCKKSGTTWTHVCNSENTPPLADGCLIVDDLNGQNPGIDKPLIGPGTFRLFIFNCGGTVACDGLVEHPEPYAAVWS